MKDRRVDPGMKYSPVFGRYGIFPGKHDFILESLLRYDSLRREIDIPASGAYFSVGEKVVVSKRNSQRSELCMSNRGN